VVAVAGGESTSAMVAVVCSDVVKLSKVVVSSGVKVLGLVTRRVRQYAQVVQSDPDRYLSYPSSQSSTNTVPETTHSSIIRGLGARGTVLISSSWRVGGWPESLCCRERTGAVGTVQYYEDRPSAVRCKIMRHGSERWMRMRWGLTGWTTPLKRCVSMQMQCKCTAVRQTK